MVSQFIFNKPPYHFLFTLCISQQANDGEKLINTAFRFAYFVK